MNSRVKKQFKSWGSLMYKHNKTEAERLLIQAVAMLSTQKHQKTLKFYSKY